MARLQWDQPGERLFETGVSHGVLFDRDGKAIAWNGLTSVSENLQGSVGDGYYVEGRKKHSNPVEGDYEGILTAFTYPDEFLDYEGNYEFEDGLYLGDQQPELFSLSYRTMVGDDLNGVDAGYKIHILYSLVAIPSNRNYATISSTTDPLEFEWTITGLPQDAPGYRPTAHVILDQRKLDWFNFSAIEATLYGTETSDGRLMSIVELISFLTS